MLGYRHDGQKGLDMKKYVCRMWIKKHGEWVCDSKRFNTVEEAVECGEKHEHLMKFDDVARRFEIIEEGE